MQRADVENRATINRDGYSVWLDLPIADLIERIPPDGRRPLAADRAQFERLYAVRRASYEHAHLRLDAVQSPVEALVERVVAALEG